MSIDTEIEYMREMARVTVDRDYENDQLRFMLDGEEMLHVTMQGLVDTRLSPEIHAMFLHAKLEISVRAASARRAINRLAL